MPTARKYLECIPITNGNEARILGSSSSWEILELIRDKGTYGATAEEIAKYLEIPLSIVYNILKGLRDAGFIEARRFSKKLGKPSMAMQEEEKRTGKQKRIYVERIGWGDFSQMTSEFRTYFTDELEDIVYDDGIIGNYCDLLDKIIMKMKENGDGKDLLP